MSTQVEIVAQKILTSKTCMNCIYSEPKLKKKKPVLKCTLSGRVVLPCMLACVYWERDYERT